MELRLSSRSASPAWPTVPVSAIPPITQIQCGRIGIIEAHKIDMTSLRTEKILSQDPGNSFARYGIAMELAGRGETEAALAEFATLLANDPDYTAGYFMAAQTLANEARIPEAIGQLNSGIASAKRTGKTMLSVRCRQCSMSWIASAVCRSGRPEVGKRTMACG